MILIRNSKLTDRDGSVMAANGLGIGTWLNLEHYMLGLAGWDKQIQACFEERLPGSMDRFRKVFFNLEDALYIKSLGIRWIRVPINHSLFYDEQKGCYLHTGFDCLKQLDHICQEAGLLYLLDMHTSPGGQNPDWHSGSVSGQSLFWTSKANQDLLCRIWQNIAAQLFRSHQLLGYDLINEPLLQNVPATRLNEFYRRCTDYIRREDPNHIIFLEGNHFSMDFSEIAPIDDPQIALTFHFYPGVWNPHILQADEKDIPRYIEEALNRILESAAHLSLPLVCGETGYELARLPRKTGDLLTVSTLDAMERRNIPWCLWDYKDIGLMSLVHPQSCSTWRALADQVHWDHHEAEKTAREIADMYGKHHGYSLSEKELYDLQFILRAAISPIETERRLKTPLGQYDMQELIESWELAKCERSEQMECILRRYSAK